MIKLGLIGAGFVSQICHLPSFTEDQNVKFVAIADTNRDILDKVSDKYLIPKKFTNYKIMLEKCKLDAVILASNRNTIEKISEYILKKKINLFVEKPQSYSSKTAKKLIKISSLNKIKYIVGYMKRFDNGIKYIKKYLKQKKIREIKSVYLENFLGDSYENPFEYYKVKKNKKYKDLNIKNKFINNFCHDLNILEYLFGKLKYERNVFFDKRKGQGLLFFRNKNIKIVMNCMHSLSKKWHEEMHINLETEKIIIKFPTPLKKNSSAKIIIKDYKNGNKIIPYIKPGWSFRNQARSFINCIKNIKYKKNINEAQYSLNTILIAEKIFNS